jgi:hypothetical protein
MEAKHPVEVLRLDTDPVVEERDQLPMGGPAPVHHLGHALTLSTRESRHGLNDGIRYWTSPGSLSQPGFQPGNRRVEGLRLANQANQADGVRVSDIIQFHHPMGHNMEGDTQQSPGPTGAKSNPEHVKFARALLHP